MAGTDGPSVSDGELDQLFVVARAPYKALA